jgi:hypothetical protein
MDVIKKDTYVMSNIMDANMIINSVYNISKKINKNICLDKDKSFRVIKNHLLRDMCPTFECEADGNNWANILAQNSKEQGNIKNADQILHYNIEYYIKILDYINNVLSSRLKGLTKSEKNNYTDQTYFSVSRIITDVTPQCNYLGLLYRILDKDQNQILKFKFSPYYNKYTNNYEISVSFTPTKPSHVFGIQEFSGSVPYLKSHFKCSMFSTMTIKFHQVLNHFFPEGFDKTRPFYEKDMNTLNKYLAEINEEYKCGLVVDDKGIVTERNKSFKLGDIYKYIPPTSSYVLNH